MTSKYKTIADKFIFVPCLDEIGSDIALHRNLNLNDLMTKALETNGCVGFNTLGYLKSKVDNLQPSPYFTDRDGIYIMRPDVIEEQKSSLNKKHGLSFILQNLENDEGMDTPLYVDTMDSCTTSSCSTADVKCEDIKCEDIKCEDITDIATDLVTCTSNEMFPNAQKIITGVSNEVHISDVARSISVGSVKKELHTVEKIFAKDSNIMNRIFIETGSYVGDGIQAAINLGFKEIHSIELSEKYYELCKEKFKSYPNVTIYKGDSGEVLEGLLEKLKGREEGITFWLDGHYSSLDTACAKDYCSPIQQELEAIRKYTHPDHVVLIDDMKDFSKESIVFNYTNNGKCGYIEKYFLEKILSTIHPCCNTYYFGPACVSYSKNKM